MGAYLALDKCIALIGVFVAKPNYQFEKRQRDLAKKSKQEEKRRQKLASRAGAGDDAPADAAAESGQPSDRSEADEGASSD